MSLTRVAMTLFIIGLLVLSAGLIVAQDDEDDDTAPDCSPEGLILAQIEINLLFDTFIDDVVEDSDGTLATIYEVGQRYQALALACGYIPDDVEGLVINTTDVERVTAILADLPGDPLRGQLLYNGEEPSTSGDTLGCAGCHNAGEVAPLTTGTWTRWDEVRSQEPQFADYTFEQYTVESILLPWDYFVPTWPQFTMPDFYPEQLSYQDLADIVAFLNSQDQLIED